MLLVTSYFELLVLMHTVGSICVQAWVYVLAELLGSALAAGAAVVLYGVGPDWARLHDHSATRPKALEDEETAFRNEVFNPCTC